MAKSYECPNCGDAVQASDLPPYAGVCKSCGVKSTFAEERAAAPELPRVHQPGYSPVDSATSADRPNRSTVTLLVVIVALLIAIGAFAFVRRSSPAPGREAVTCSDCSGTGKRTCDACANGTVSGGMAATCPKCGGKAGEPCAPCRGTGRR